jgi:hypothetical protein
MPAMADLTTVKKADGTTNIAYTALIGSAGDKTAAVWRAPVVPNGVGPAHQPELRMTSQWNGPRTARRLGFAFSYPYVPLVGGVATLTDRALFEGSLLVPQGMSTTEINEAAYQCLSALGQSLVKQAAAAGWAPN